MDPNDTMGVIVGGMQVDMVSYVRTPTPMSHPTAPLDVVSPSPSEEGALSALNDTGMCFLPTEQQGHSEDAAAFFKFVMYGVLLNILGLLGLAGNIISITVLSRPKMRSSINCCFIGLSVFDMIVVLTAMLLFGINEVCNYTDSMKQYSENFVIRATPFVYPLGLIAQTGSVYLTVTVTIERYVAVCLPLRARSLCTYGRAKIYVMCVALFSVVYNLPRFWEISYKDCLKDGEPGLEMIPTELRTNSHYIRIYIMWMYLFVMYLVPFLSLIIFNTFIYKEVRAANQERQRLSRLERKEIGLAVMLLVVVIVFFVCNVLPFIVNIMELQGYQPDELIIVSNLLVTVNSSVNFIIYCIFGQKFRRLFLKMFCSGFIKTSVRRGTTYRDSGYGNNSMYGDSRCLTNGRSTQIIRMSSWNGSQRSRSGSNPNADHDVQPRSRSSWRPFSKYASVPLGDSSTPRTASSSFTPSRSPSLVPPVTCESDHAL